MYVFILHTQIHISLDKKKKGFILNTQKSHESVQNVKQLLFIPM